MPRHTIPLVLYSLPLASSQELPNRAETLPKIESGELASIEFSARVFDLSGKNKNYFAFRQEDLPSFAASFKNQPFLRDHDVYSIEAREGIIQASLTNNGHIEQTIRLTTRKGMTAYLEGQIDRFSVGFRPEWIMCSVCKTDWATCTHWPGRKYKTESGEVLCELVMIKPKGSETSAVNNPAMDGTGLLSELNAFKKKITGTSASAANPTRKSASAISTLKGANMANKKKNDPELDADPIEEEELDETQDEHPDAAAAARLTRVSDNAKRIKKNEEESTRILAQACKNLLATSLTTSKLPKASAERIRKNFEARLAEGELDGFAEALETAIDDKRAELNELSSTSKVQGPGRGGHVITGGHSSEDQIQAAVEDMFGVPRDENTKNVTPARLSGIRELYLMLTGDHNLHGGYFPDMMYLATTADFTGLVKNALNKAVVQSWEELGKAGYNWWEKITVQEHFTSLNDITGILVGTVGLLPTINEQAEYTELAIGDSPEVASFVKKGGYIPLTIELIDRDETRKLRAYPRELANAALRTLSGRVAEVFTSNAGAGPTMADGGALFNATAVTTLGGHANLLTTALGTNYTAWEAVAAAMYNQPMLVKQATGYYGTGSKQAIDPKYCLVPRALRGQANDLFLPRWSSLDNKHHENLYASMVEPVTVPEWTDATDWAAVADPLLAPCIVVGERFGIKPEIYVAGRETDAAVFMNDEHRIKVRMFNAILVQDFRGLHKSNV